MQDTLTLKDILSKGLRPTEFNDRNSPLCTTLYGARCYRTGLTPPNPPTNPIPSGQMTAHSLSVAFPYPQVFKGRTDSIVVTGDSIFLADDNWTLTEQTVYESVASSTNSVSNGTFASATGWTTLSGTWSISGGKATATAGSTPILQQLAASLAVALVPGTLYRVSFTVEVTQGSIQLTVGGQGTRDITRSGTYFEEVLHTAGVDVSLIGSDSFRGSIDDVKVRPVSIATFSTTNPWHFADGGPTWFLCSGDVTLFRSPFNGRVYKSSVVNPNSACYVRGRFIFAGFDKTEFQAFTEYETYYDAYHTLLIDFGQSVDANYVHWTSVSAGDQLSLFFPWIVRFGPDGGFTETDPFYSHILRREDSGFSPIPGQGFVLRVLPLGNGFVAYGTSSISYFQPSDDGVRFLRTDIANFGIADRSAAYGNDAYHVFMDAEGSLWSLNTQGQLQLLDYREFLSTMLDDDNIIITLDESESEFTLATETQAYLKTPTGMSQVPHATTSSFRSGGVLYGIQDDVGPEGFKMISDIIDFGGKKVKSIILVEVGADDPQGIDFYIHQRMKGTGTWGLIGPIDIREDGLRVTGVPGVEYRFEARSTADVKIDYINVTWRTDGAGSFRTLVTDEAVSVPDPDPDEEVTAVITNTSETWYSDLETADGSPDAAEFPNRLNWMAPLPIFVEGFTSSSTAGDIASWVWDFGDGSEPVLAFNAAHIYETPGTYTITLTVTDEADNIGIDTLEITVQERSGATYYVNESGSDSNDGTSIASAWRTASKAFSEFAAGNFSPGDTVQFARGGTYTLATGSVNLDKSSIDPLYGVYFTAYGTGAKPILNLTSGASWAFLSGWNGLAWIGFSDLNIQGNTYGFLSFYRNSSHIWAQRCNFDNVSQFYVAQSAYETTARELQYLFVMDCTGGQTCSAYTTAEYSAGKFASSGPALFMKGSRCAQMRNTVHYSGNHVSYNSFVDRGVFYQNDYRYPSFSKTAIRLSASALTGDHTKPTQLVHITQNVLKGCIDQFPTDSDHSNGRYPDQLVELKPNDAQEQVQEDVWFTDNTVADGQSVLLVASQRRCRILRNTFTTEDNISQGEPRFQFGHTFETLPMDDVLFYGNTINTKEAGRGGQGMPIFYCRRYEGSDVDGLGDHRDFVITNNDITVDGRYKYIGFGPGPTGETTLANEDAYMVPAASYYSDYNTLRRPAGTHAEVIRYGGGFQSGGFADTLAEWITRSAAVASFGSQPAGARDTHTTEVDT